MMSKVTWKRVFWYILAETTVSWIYSCVHFVTLNFRDSSESLSTLKRLPGGIIIIMGSAKADICPHCSWAPATVLRVLPSLIQQLFYRLLWTIHTISKRVEIMQRASKNQQHSMHIMQLHILALRYCRWQTQRCICLLKVLGHICMWCEGPHSLQCHPTSLTIDTATTRQPSHQSQNQNQSSPQAAVWDSFY